MPLAYFLPRHPDYLGAWIAPEDLRDEDQLPPALLALVRAGAAVVERKGLPPEHGFASHSALYLVRLRAPR